MKATNNWNRSTKVFNLQLQSLKNIGVRALDLLADKLNEVGMGIAAARALFNAFTTGNFTGAMDMAREAVREYQVMLRAAAQAQEVVTGGGSITGGAIGEVGEAADDTAVKVKKATQAVFDLLGAMFRGETPGGPAPEMVDVVDDGPDFEGMKAKAEMVIASVGMFNQQAMSMIDSIGELTVRRFGENSEKTKRIMRDMFYAQKAVAISQVIIDAAAAVMRTFTIDPTGVLAAVMSPIIAANAGLQIAVIAGEQPTFHTGGMVPGQSAAPDEVGITALAGEGVVSRRGMAALDAINRGEAMTGGSPIVVYGARVFNQVDADLVRLPGSSVSRAIRSKTRRRLGHRQ
jgi:hypothetical protein